MKRLLIISLAVFAVVIISTRAHAIHEIIPSETTVALPGPDAAVLEEYITRYEPYKTWRLWPEKAKLYKGREPHGELLTTFVNDAAHYGISKKKRMKEGAIIVSENYSSDRKFLFLTVMYKLYGFSPRAGDWFWARYAPDGSVQAAGKVRECIECHSSAKENDFILGGRVID